MGGGGGSMIRAVHRTVARAGATSLPDPILSANAVTRATSPSAPSRRIHRANSCNSNNLVLLSESGSSLPECKSSTGNFWHSFRGSLCPDECDWVAVDKNEVDRLRETSDDFYSWHAPSHEEIHTAVSALTRVYGGTAQSLPVRDKFTCDVDREVAGSLHRSSSAGSEVDWSEPSLLLRHPATWQPPESKAVSDAIHLFQSEPSIQRMVVSLSSDRAVWDAILNNEVVQEMCNACRAGSSCSTIDQSEPPAAAISFLKQLFDNAKVRIKMLMEKVHLLVNELFRRLEEEISKETDEKLRISFMLSMLVLFVVVVARLQRA